MNLKAAILGAGNMGLCHSANLIKLGVEITAVCDTNESARKHFKDVLKLEAAAEYSCFDEMLEKSRFDVLFICIPPFAQEEQFQKAARARKHIFIEKPIALATEAGMAMVRAAEESGVITQVGFHMRWGAAVKKLAGLVKSGAAGRPVLFTGQYECNSLHSPWWMDVKLSGGQILEQAIHIYDMCRYFMGHPGFAAGIKGNVCHGRVPGYTVEDVSASFAGFAGGAASAITATNCAVPGLWEGRFTVVFEKVTVFFENPDKARFMFIENEGTKCEYVDEVTDMKLDEVRDFIASVTNGKETGCCIKEGYLSLSYVEAVVRSAAMGGEKVELAGM